MYDIEKVEDVMVENLNEKKICTVAESLAEASTFVEVIEKRQGLKIACLEGIAYRNGWITEEKMCELAKSMLKNQYGQYLLRVIEEKKEEVDSDTLR